LSLGEINLRCAFLNALVVETDVCDGGIAIENVLILILFPVLHDVPVSCMDCTLRLRDAALVNR
jgi:hypothetical protein